MRSVQIQYNKTAVEGFYQVEKLGEGISVDGAWGQVTRAERWEGHLKMDYNTAVSCCNTDSKRQCRCCLIELAILLTHFMKEYFNSVDDIQFFHTFSSIS